MLGSHLAWSVVPACAEFVCAVCVHDGCNCAAPCLQPGVRDAMLKLCKAAQSAPGPPLAIRLNVVHMPGEWDGVFLQVTDAAPLKS